jgi:hypothetical protein
MAYRIIELEVTQPLSAIELERTRMGIAILVRRKGRPIEFWMQERRRGSRMETEELARLISEKTSTRLHVRSIREELQAATTSAGEVRCLRCAIAVCTKDRPEMLQRCLASILRINRDGAHSSFEVLVVDNAPSDLRTQKLVESLPGIVTRANPTRPRLSRVTAPYANQKANCWPFSMTMSWPTKVGIAG